MSYSSFELVKKWAKCGSGMDEGLIPAVDVEFLWLFEAPEGSYPAHVDKAGRLKWPAEFEKFLTRFPGRQFFASTLDREKGCLYDMAGWRKVKGNLEDPPDEELHDAAENTFQTAMTFGERVELDDQGRTMLPVELRRTLDLEGKKVRVWVRKGAIEIVNHDRWAERDAAIRARASADAALLRKKKLF